MLVSHLDLIAGVDIPTIAISTSNAGPLAGNVGSKALPGASLRNVDSNMATAYAHQWGAALERHRRFPNRTNVEFIQVLDKIKADFGKIDLAGSAATANRAGLAGDGHWGLYLVCQLAGAIQAGAESCRIIQPAGFTALAVDAPAGFHRMGLFQGFPAAGGEAFPGAVGERGKWSVDSGQWTGGKWTVVYLCTQR